MAMALMEDVDIQRRGIVAIGYSIGSFHRGKPDLEMHRQFVKTGSWLPMKITAVYMCFSNPRFVSIAEVVTHMFNSFLRVRFRPIQGKLQFLLYSRYGIPRPTMNLSSVEVSTLLLVISPLCYFFRRNTPRV